MIKSRIIDNDMGSVAKVPLTGRGTIHGLTFGDGTHALTEFPVGLLEMVTGDGGLGRFREHATEQLSDTTLVQQFTDAYKSMIDPVLKSGKTRY